MDQFQSDKTDQPKSESTPMRLYFAKIDAFNLRDESNLALI
jgi:hypothetical protein